MSPSIDAYLDREGEGGNTDASESPGRSPRKNPFYRHSTNNNLTPTKVEESPQQFLAPKNDEGCTAFHRACQETSSLEELQSKFDAVALEKQSSTGKNCLHYLALNADLILSIKKGNGFHKQIMKSIDIDKASQLVGFIVDRICLVEKDKRCLLLEADPEGRIPFQEVMENWIKSVEEKVKDDTGRRSSVIDLNKMSLSQSVSSNMCGSHRSASQSQSSRERYHALFSLYLLSEMMQRLKAKVEQGKLPFLAWRNKSARMIKSSTKPPSPSGSFSGLSSSMRIFSSLKTLSTSEPVVNLSNTDDSVSIAMVFEKVSEIDNLIKTLLTVVIGKEEREAIFNLSLIRNVMIQQNNVGPWIIDMLDSSSNHTRINIIDYFKRLSTLTEKKRIDSDDSQLNELDDLADKLGRLHGLIPSMMVLSTRMTEEVATIPLITRALDKKMLSPFISCALFFDIAGLAVLLATFRQTVNCFMIDRTLCPWAYYLANAAIYYFILRIWGKMISYYYLFKSHNFLHFRFSKIWIILNTSSVLLSWICIWIVGYFVRKEETVVTDASRIVIAVTTVLLWLNLIETLTVVNVKLATFVLAIRKITKEVLWYLFLLAGFGLCSSQVMFTLMIPNGENDCIEPKLSPSPSNGPFLTPTSSPSSKPSMIPSDTGDKPSYCSPPFYYSKMYSAVLGLDEWGLKSDDVENPKFNKTPFSDVMYGIFSFIIMILLLNSLIAVISDSYESCLLQSKRLFGRARIQFLGDTLAFQNLFVRPSDVEQQRWSHGGFTFLVSSMILYAGFVLFELLVINKQKTNNKTWMYGSFALNAFITVCFNVILAQQIQARAQRRFVGIFTKTFLWPLNIIQWVIWWLQGTSLSYVDSNDGPEEWSGRVSYLKGEMHRLGEEHKKEMLNLRSQIKQSEIDVVDRLEHLLRSHQSELLGRQEALEERHGRSESETS